MFSNSKLVSSLFRVNQAVSGLLKSCQKHASLSVKDIQNDNPEAETGPLKTRFMRNIALDNVKTLPVVPRVIKYSQYYPISDHRLFTQELRKTDESQLSRLLVYTTNYRTNADVQKFIRVINDLDMELHRRMDKLPYDELFQLTYYFMLIVPNRITQLEFFRKAIERMVADFAKSPENQTPEYFVQIAFYLGLLKKNRNGMDMLYNFLNAHLDRFMDDLTEISFAMVANAAFKCSLKLSNEKFNARLEAEVLKYDENSPVDIQLLITFIKSIRHNRVVSPPLLEKVDSLICGDALSEADFRGLAHLFTFFAESRHITANLDKVLNEKCLSVIQAELEQLQENEDYQLNTVFRQKDLRMYLWANAFLGLKSLSQKHLEGITEFLLYQFGQEEPHHKLDDLVDASLSLAMMNYYPKRLIAMVLKEGSFYKQPHAQNRVKLDSRFFLLTSSISIEAPHLLTDQWKDQQATDFVTPAPEYLTKGRTFFMTLSSILEGLKEKLNIQKISIIAPIKHSNIASYLVEFENGANVIVDALDQTNTLMGDVTPHGIMAHKLRLLKCLDRDVVLVSSRLGRL